MEGMLFYWGFEKKVKFALSGDLVYWGMREICKRRLWKWATLSIGAPLGNLEGRGGLFTGDFEKQ
jgi:hypothetical protein